MVSRTKTFGPTCEPAYKSNNKRTLIDGTTLAKLKQRAKMLYYKATEDNGADCGNQLLDVMIPSRVTARKDFGVTWEKIQELDPSAPPNPFEK